jgi:hypothetical protein
MARLDYDKVTREFLSSLQENINLLEEKVNFLEENKDI